MPAVPLLSSPGTGPRRARRRRALRLAAVLLAVGGLLLWWLLPLGQDQPSGRITFSTGVRTGVYQRYGQLLKGALDRELPRVATTLRDSEGSQQNLARVASGEADFTIATADAVATYLQEERPGAGELRGCTRLYDDYVQLVVAKGSPVRTAADLRGLRVGVGQEGSGVRLLADRLLDAAGLDPSQDVRPVPAGIDTMPKLLEQGRLDAFFWSGGLPTSAVLRLSERFPVRLVPLDRELVDRVHAEGGPSRYYRSAVIPADAYPAAQDGPVQTVAVANLLVTTGRVDAALTEGVTRTVIGSRDRVGREVHPAQVVDLRTAIYTDPLPLHEGARRYYRSVKP
ncbi:MULTISPECIES: TAXI family TRAP transporter solute-binding subunit [Streptomyces]|uniref:NMT1/THI5 like protein n=1 Tax=Streptomyces rubrolavendulae TaxID=285473 RepID=A0A1D8G7J2_9ACTN|nr:MULTISPECIES: TAXI family TRAP transporter solute-binding subunit [Streptomyces]AOT61410.1 NMT1/THI5 like protein [Streptomyces rubrolavendulae]UQS30367.1 TAXI family TRAP transporter solute-binding subunit [Streptomyces fradiae]